MGSDKTEEDDNDIINRPQRFQRRKWKGRRKLIKNVLPPTEPEPTPSNVFQDDDRTVTRPER